MNAASRWLPPLLSGALFGAGLALGGMTDPRRVRAFLDLFGAWDPSLAFVMVGAIAVTAIAWIVRRRMTRPVFAPKFQLPSRRDIDPKLVGGATLFGVGWGVAGLCPGPAMATIAFRPLSIAPFLAAMVGGMLVHRFLFESGPKPERNAKA